jgi:hypothetical protein
MKADRWIELAQTLVEPHNDGQCTACLDQLDDYVAAQLTGQPYMTMFPIVARHLDRCVICADDYARVYDARLSEASSVVPRTRRVPDLSFLLPEQTQSQSRVSPAQLRAQLRADQLKAVLHQRLERSLNRVRLVIDRTLLDLLPPPQRGGLAFRDAGEPRPTVELHIESPHATITRVDLQAYDAEGPSFQIVRCTIALREREWPDLADVPIRLIWDEGQREMLTDAWGEVVFTDVPADVIGRMALEVDVPTTS